MRWIKSFSKNWSTQENPCSPKDEHTFEIQGGFDTSRFGFELVLNRHRMFPETDYVCYTFTIWLLFFGFDISLERILDVDGIIGTEG